MGTVKRVARNIQKRARESADLLRRRKTEIPFLTGWPKKSHVVVGPVRKEKRGEKDIFVAEFVRPRAGSQLAPFFDDHQIALAAEAAAHQVAIASMKKFGNAKGKRMLVVRNSFIWRKPIPPKPQMLVEVSLKNETVSFGRHYKIFVCTFRDKADQKTRYANGELTILVEDKKK